MRPRKRTRPAKRSGTRRANLSTCSSLPQTSSSKGGRSSPTKRKARSRTPRPLRRESPPTNSTRGGPGRRAPGAQKRARSMPLGIDPELAGEVARRRVAGRRRHRDDAVEDRKDALEDGLAQPVPEEALGVGVKGRHDRAFGVVHGRPAQAGHEGLVDVEDVELLVFEHDVDVGQQVDRRREVAHRAVVAHREGAAGEEVARIGLVGPEQAVALAEQHLAHAFAGRLDGQPVVARGDDRDAVPLRGEALGERRDMVVHAAGHRPRVRREHRDPVAGYVH